MLTSTATRLVVRVSDAWGDRRPFWPEPTRVCSTPSCGDDAQGVIALSFRYGNKIGLAWAIVLGEGGQEEEGDRHHHLDRGRAYRRHLGQVDHAGEGSGRL